MSNLERRSALSPAVNERPRFLERAVAWVRNQVSHTLLNAGIGGAIGMLPGLALNAPLLTAAGGVAGAVALGYGGYKFGKKIYDASFGRNVESHAQSDGLTRLASQVSTSVSMALEGFLGIGGLTGIALASATASPVIPIAGGIAAGILAAVGSVQYGNRLRKLINTGSGRGAAIYQLQRFPGASGTSNSQAA